MAPDIDTIHHGGHPIKNRKRLRAGSLILDYEAGNIRHVNVGQTEIIRMIYPAVRDKNWLTIRPVIKDELFEINDDSFVIRYTIHFKSGDIDFIANTSVEGRIDNSLLFSFEGEALSSFKKNRIGLCTLHPVETFAGKVCRIVHTDGRAEELVFPEEISPHQVFKDIRSIIWKHEGVECKLYFEGDIFETEDQRNWTDASFKTYSTPLSVPYPVTMDKDARISQKVTLRVETDQVIEPDFHEKTVIKLSSEEIYKLPSIGICQSGRTGELDQEEIRVIRPLKFDHYRVDLHLFKHGWQFRADQAYQESSELGCPLMIALFFDDSTLQQVNNFIDWYTGIRNSVSTVLIFHKDYPTTPSSLAMEVIPLLRKVNPGVELISGTNANFAELNRNRPEDNYNDSICFSVHPQEHLSDNTSLVENLKAQEYAILSARKLAGKKKITVSPVTIQRRFNSNNTYVELPWRSKEIPPQVDSRQMSLFGAGWTVISIKYLSEAGADALTYYETVGERGIVQGSRSTLWPDQFKSAKGMIFPVYHVLRFILGNKKLTGIKCISSNPLAVDCIALSDKKQIKLCLVNFTGSPQPVSLDCCAGLSRVRALSSVNYLSAASDQRWTGTDNERTIKSQDIFETEPYSLNFIEGWRKH